MTHIYGTCCKRVNPFVLSAHTYEPYRHSVLGMSIPLVTIRVMLEKADFIIDRNSSVPCVWRQISNLYANVMDEMRIADFITDPNSSMHGVWRQISNFYA